MPGLGRSKNDVASLAYVPGISIHGARPCRLNRDCRIVDQTEKCGEVIRAANIKVE
jgi:hypothetical protein